MRKEGLTPVRFRPGFSGLMRSYGSIVEIWPPPRSRVRLPGARAGHPDRPASLHSGEDSRTGVKTRPRVARSCGLARDSRERHEGTGARQEAMADKWVYLFAEGSLDMIDLLGGKGAGLAEMSRANLPVPPGFTITTERLPLLLRPRQALPGRDVVTEQGRAAGRGRGHGQALRRSLQSSAGLGPFRRPGFDAGHDGHRPQPGYQPRHIARPGAADRRRTLRLGCLPPLRTDVRRDRAGCPRREPGRRH